MLAGTVPSRPAGDLDDEALLVKAQGSKRFDLTVVEMLLTAPRMLRITLSGAGIETMSWQPAQDLTLMVARVAGRDIRRRYTIAAQAHDAVQLDVFLHGHGIGTDAPAQVLVEVDDPAEWQAYGQRGRAQTRWTWLPRGRSLTGDPVVSLPRDGDGHAYVSGDVGRVSAWCDKLERLGLDPSAISHKAYWGTGRVNATHGEPLL
jgi:NADPH-dependent ferric siderophore reductase